MATVTAFIRTSKTDKSKLANVRFRLRDGRDFQIFHKSELNVSPERWDEKQQKIKARVLIDEKERQYFDKAVTDRKNLIKNAYLHQGKSLTSDLLDIEIDKALHPELYIVSQLSFFELYEKFLSDNAVSPSTQEKRRIVRNSLQRFEQYRKSELDFSTITADTLKDYEHFLRNENEYNENQPQRSNNTIVVMFKIVRTFFIWCNNNDYANNKSFSKFKAPAEKYGTPFYLTIDELNALYNYDLSGNLALERQRDIFVFQCVIGCRVGDLHKLTKSSVIDGAIQYVAEKTKGKEPKTIRVPLNSIATEILTKYADLEDEKLLPLIAEQKYNEAIKNVFAAAEITRSVTVLNKLTGVEEIRPLNEVASSHLARRTFCGNLYKKVKDPNLVCSLSGHADGSKAFARYRDIDDEMKTELVKMLEL